jgi:hypothetical protein
VKVGASDKCWEWQGWRNHHGYGVVYYRLKGTRLRILTHRLSYAFTHSVDLSEGTLVLHSCDNRSCVNPAHLRVGSQKDNGKDMVDRGRSTRGELNPHAKLKEKDILRIRRLRVKGFTYDAIAAEYGYTKGTVGSIVRGDTWSHVA